MVEIVGTLVDNAYEACNDEFHHVIIEVDSENDKMEFLIKNQIDENMKLEMIGKFFEKGFSTKSKNGKRGLGLFQAKKICEKYGGEITVGLEMIDDRNYIWFKVVI